MFVIAILQSRNEWPRCTGFLGEVLDGARRILIKSSAEEETIMGCQ